MSSGRHGVLLSGAALGAFATAVQISLLRGALAISSGSELSLGIALAVWLCAVAPGAAMAARFRIPIPYLPAAAVAATLISMTGLALLTLLPAWIGLPPGGRLSTSGQCLAIAAALAPPAAICGFLFTAVVSLAPAGADRDVRIARTLYIAEAVGALIAGLAVAFALQTRLDPFSLTGGVGVLLIGALTWAFRGSLRRTGRILYSLAAVAFAIGLTGPTEHIDRWLQSRSAPGLEGDLRGALDTPWGRLILKSREGQFSLLRDGSISWVFPEPWESPLTIHLALSLHPDPDRVLLLEGPLSDRLPAVRQHGVRRVDAIALDPGEDQLTAPYLPSETRDALRAPGTRRLYGDSRPFLRGSRGVYDVIIAAVPPPLSAAANRFHTAEFFAAAADALAPGGIFAIEVPGSANYLSEEGAVRLAGEAATLRTAFRELRFFPGTTTLIAATRSRSTGLAVDPGVLVNRFRAQSLPGTRIVPEQLLDRIDPGREATLQRQIESIPAVINRDGEPAGYIEAIALEDRQQGNVSVVTLASGTALAGFAFPVLLLLAGLARRRTRPLAAPLFGMFTTGLCGMGGEILVLVSYSAGCGHVHTGLAWIIAVFMLGLALGAAIGDRPGCGRVGRLFADGAMAISAAILFFLLPRLGDAGYPYAVLTLLLGAATGAAFAVFLKSIRELMKTDIIPATSMIIAADHAGAAIGAFATALAWLPSLGLTRTLAAFTLLKLFSAAANQTFFRNSASEP